MKIALIGHGKMGKEIELQAKQLKIPVSQIIDSKEDLERAVFQSDEVAIEFTSPEACLENLQILIQKKVPVVCGTTGWLKHVDEIEALVKQNKTSFLYASNFSVGVHLFWKALAQLSKQMNAFDQYNVQVVEAHHIHKKDKPSGTAKTSAEIITQNMPRINAVNIESIRDGEIVGDHRILFESGEDIIELSHSAKSRACFAKGAIVCASWLSGKQGFFTIEDYIQEKFA